MKNEQKNQNRPDDLEFKLRGHLASKLFCWHRLTEAEAQNLMHVFETNLILPGYTGHDSDCSVHNEPAFPVGPCDCRLATEEEKRKAHRKDLDLIDVLQFQLKYEKERFAYMEMMYQTLPTIKVFAALEGQELAPLAPLPPTAQPTGCPHQADCLIDGCNQNPDGNLCDQALLIAQPAELVVVDAYADADEMNTLHGEAYGVDWTYPTASKKDEPYGWVATWKGQLSEPTFYPGWEPPNAIDEDWNEYPVSLVPVFAQPQQSTSAVPPMPEFERYADSERLEVAKDGKWVWYDDVAAAWPKGTL